MTAMIYHMCPAEAWEQAVASGRYIGTADDRRDGFLHFSTASQIAESARRHRAGQQGLVLVAVEAARLGERLRWEKSRDGARFPHLYGPLFPHEAAAVVPLPLGPDGEHVFPALSWRAGGLSRRSRWPRSRRC
jgi:uncharacterized protein (DUF952 family)